MKSCSIKKFVNFIIRIVAVMTCSSMQKSSSSSIMSPKEDSPFLRKLSDALTLSSHHKTREQLYNATPVDLRDHLREKRFDMIELSGGGEAKIDPLIMMTVIIRTLLKSLG